MRGRKVSLVSAIKAIIKAIGGGSDHNFGCNSKWGYKESPELLVCPSFYRIEKFQVVFEISLFKFGHLLAVR